MNKLLKILTMAFLFSTLTVGKAEAADVSVGIESPKSPTNQRDFTITFVALDIQNRPVTVRCYKKLPGEGSFSIFGPDINLPAGGDSDNCEVTSSLVSGEGTYEFYVTATAGSDTEQSDTVSVEYKLGGPANPSYLGKEQPSSCQYLIKFKTADDGNETVKVEVYRSSEATFNADSGTRIATVGIGSNQEGSHLDTVPQCNQAYYYAIRAFNDAGTGSDAVGDTQSVTITEASPTITTAAIPVGSGTVSQAGQPTPTEPTVAGEQPAGNVLGETTTAPATPDSEKAGSFFMNLVSNKIVLLGSALLLMALGISLFRRSRA